MACNRHVISRAPSPRAKRRKIDGAEPQFFESQRNRAQDLRGNSMRLPIEPFVDSAHGFTFESSIVSFASHQPTHPSASIQERATSLTSGSVSRLEYERGLSIHTPSTPTGSSNGDFGDPFANNVQLEHQSPINADSTLCGIIDNSYYPRGYGLESFDNGVSLVESRDESSCAFEWNQRDASRWISGAKTPRAHPLKEPWNGYHIFHDAQGNATEIVEEGQVLQLGYGFTHISLELPHDTSHLISSACGSRVEAQSIFPIAEQFLRQQASTTDVCEYPDESQAHERTPGSTSLLSSFSSSSGSPLPFKNEKSPKRGIRKGKLKESHRINAEKMRKEGSCNRCFYMKEQCVMENHKCKRCLELSNKYRTWYLPCSPTGLDRRSQYMCPDVLILKLKGERVRAFLKDKIRWPRECQPFELYLTLGSGTPFQFQAIEITPPDQGATRMFGFLLDKDGSNTKTEMISPPIVPYLLDRVLIAKRANQWIDCVIREPDSDFLEDYFSEPDEIWEREMLAIISRYHQDHLGDLEESGDGPYQTLRWAFKMAVLNHIMSQPLVVPEDKVPALSRQLRFYKMANRDGWVCPRFTNRVIKHMLLPMLQHAAERVLRDLSSSKMLRDRGGEDRIWDQAFSIVFLCLVVVGKTQVSVAECAELNTDESTSYENAKTAIFEMEEELAMHLIGMFHYRFGTTKKGRAFNPLARDACDRPKFNSELARDVREATAPFRDRLVEPGDLQKLDFRKMRKENVMRLLAKFMQAFLQK